MDWRQCRPNMTRSPFHAGSTPRRSMCGASGAFSQRCALDGLCFQAPQTRIRLVITFNNNLIPTIYVAIAMDQIQKIFHTLGTPTKHIYPGLEDLPAYKVVASPDICICTPVNCIWLGHSSLYTDILIPSICKPGPQFRCNHLAAWLANLQAWALCVGSRKTHGQTRPTTAHVYATFVFMKENRRIKPHSTLGTIACVCSTSPNAPSPTRSRNFQIMTRRNAWTVRLHCGIHISAICRVVSAIWVPKIQKNESCFKLTGHASHRFLVNTGYAFLSVYIIPFMCWIQPSIE